MAICKVTIVTGSISRLAGGLFTSVRKTAQTLHRCGDQVTVLSGVDAKTAEDLREWSPLEPRTLDCISTKNLFRFATLRCALNEIDPEIVHQQGVWEPYGGELRRWCTRRSRACVISPRGMLDPWALKNAAWKKRIAMALFARRDLLEAGCIHALAEAERSAIRALGLTTPVAVIPNGIDLPAKGPPAGKPLVMQGDERKTLLFLGRIHPKKGLSEMLDAWAKATADRPSLRNNWLLVIAGWDDGGHLPTLRRQVENLGLESAIRFIGPLYGEEKTRILHHADAFILASYSEGLPMAVLEAWAHRLPVFMSRFCNLPEGFAVGAAVDTGVTPDEIARALLERLDDPEVDLMGLRGRALVEEKFTWDCVAQDHKALYSWLTNGGAPPAFVDGP